MIIGSLRGSFFVEVEMYYEDRRERNRRVLIETLEYIDSSSLSFSVRDSIGNLKFFPDGKGLKNAESRFSSEARIIVTRRKTTEAAYSYMDGSVALLDFASARTPGGGTRRGSSAQEESLCRISTLLPVLESKQAQPYYSYHKGNRGDDFYSDSLLIVPAVTFFRSDDARMSILPESEWKKADVVVSAAPNLRHGAGYDAFSERERERYIDIMTRRIRSVFNAMEETGADNIILGAFGCGVFENPPEVVATIFREVQKDYMRCFKTIEYAVYARDENDVNYSTFRKVLS